MWLERGKSMDGHHQAKGNKMQQIKKGRGKGKKEALMNTSIRLEQKVIDEFRHKYGSKMQAKMREVLSNFIQGEVNEEA